MKKSFFILGIFFPFVALAQLQNLDFEYWDNPINPTTIGNPNRPTGWVQSGGINIFPNDYFNSPPEQDAFSNNYALKLNVYMNYFKDMAIQTSSINYRPLRLKGYYKYVENIISFDGNNGVNQQADIAQVSVYLTKWNVATSQRDTIGSGVLNLQQEKLSYTEFNVNIVYVNNEIPDSVTVILDPSLVNRSPGFYNLSADGTTSHFTVDSLSLENSALGLDNLSSKEDIKVYPNPVQEILYLENFKGNINLLDMSGKEISRHNISLNSNLFVGNLSPGVYMLILNDGDKTQTVKFIKK